MTVIESLGYSGPFSSLTPEQKLLCGREYRRLRPIKRKPESKEKRAEYWKRYYSRHGDSVRQRRKKAYWEDLSVSRLRASSYRARNRDVVNEKLREYYFKNKDKEIARSKEYAKNNRSRVNERARVRSLERYSSDPQYRMALRMRTRLGEVLRRRNHKCSVTLRIDRESLVRHLESKFEDGMSWDNYGSHWHVDHIVPCSAFDLTNQAHVVACFSNENLRPLWKEQNLKKGSAIMPEFSDLAERLLSGVAA